MLNADCESSIEVGRENALEFVALDIVKQQQSHEIPIQKRQQWIAKEKVPIRDELQTSTPDLRTIAPRLPQLSNVDSLLAVGAQVGSNRLVVPPPW